MSEFTVTFLPSGQETFTDADYDIKDHGVLWIKSEGRVRQYSPAAWHHIEEAARPPSSSRGSRATATVLR